jgi:hypothetical protein
MILNIFNISFLLEMDSMKVFHSVDIMKMLFRVILQKKEMDRTHRYCIFIFWALGFRSSDLDYIAQN